MAETIVLAPAAQPLSDEDLPAAERLQLANSAPTTAQEVETELAVDVNALADAIIAGEQPLSDIQPLPVRVEEANIEQALLMALAVDETPSGLSPPRTTIRPKLRPTATQAAVRAPAEPAIAAGSALVQFGPMRAKPWRNKNGHGFQQNWQASLAHKLALFKQRKAVDAHSTTACGWF